MLKSFKYHLRPTEVQSKLINKHIGSSRFVYNAVNIKNFALKNYVSGTDTQTRNELPTLVGVLTSEAQPIGSAVGG